MISLITPQQNQTIYLQVTNTSRIFPRVTLDREFWYNQAQSQLQDVLEAHLTATKGPAKNVILFVGDGMGIASITAGRILKGQKMGQSGEEFQLSFEKFPHVALSKVSLL